MEESLLGFSAEYRRDYLGMFDPIHCVILVQGALESSWSERLGGLTIAAHTTPGGPRTTLVGVLVDQAVLQGVLKTLYDLGLPLLSVTSF
jgi:hypothetical protein